MVNGVLRLASEAVDTVHVSHMSAHKSQIKFGENLMVDSQIFMGEKLCHVCALSYK